ncbi:putative lipid II flippase FtsW [Patescibacteria group bacterium]|nr:putative lipid II flippase FtsW [Patescibacteria group bacterium]MBU2632953.1 putative lipid II flippase FtsW [Patescibacteria group bacterium]
MSVRKKYDVFFLSIVLILLLSGFFILSSASLGLAARADRNSYFPLIKQLLLGGGVGILLLCLTSRLYYKKWKKISFFLFVFSFLLTILVLEPHLGFEHGGAKRWLSFGSYTFQPSELLKFSFIIYLSHWLSQKRHEISSFKTGLLPFLVIVGFVGVLLIAQPDLGTFGVISITSITLFLLAGGRFLQTGLVILSGFILLATLIYFQPYQKERILVFFDNSYDLQGAGYQIKQAKIALGSGGIFGQGLGKGLSKFNYLPEPMGDSIFAIVGEEFGFIGTTFIVILFFLFLFKSIHIALKTTDMFGRLLVSGIAILITVQSFVNMYAIVGLIPLTGLPLVFISQGGSALVLALAGTGIILNVSKKT